MRIQSIELEVVQGSYSGKQWDTDRYLIEVKTPMSTQEFTVSVDHTDKEVTGDCIRYGDWGDVDPGELQELIEKIEAAGKLSRSYDGYTFK